MRRRLCIFLITVRGPERNGADGLIHISELQDGHTKSVNDVVHTGQIVDAKLINIDFGTLSKFM